MTFQCSGRQSQCVGFDYIWLDNVSVALLSGPDPTPDPVPAIPEPGTRA